MLNPSSILGAAILAAILFVAALVIVILIRRGARRVAQHLTDVTVLQFVSVFAQLLTYLVAFMLYAHLIPALRALGTALLAGASVVSVVVGLAAQDTLGNLIAGFSLVLSGTVRVGDTVRVDSPVGVISATVSVISLGFTVLLDDDEHEVVIPNNVIMGSAITHVARAASAPPATPTATHPPAGAAPPPGCPGSSTTPAAR